MSVMKVNFSLRSVVTRMQVDPKLHYMVSSSFLVNIMFVEIFIC